MRKNSPMLAASAFRQRWHVAERQKMLYIFHMNQHAKEILRRVETWPEEDQAELAEVAREIEARRSGVYVLNEERLRNWIEAKA